jgi:hypothetical protein
MPEMSVGVIDTITRYLHALDLRNAKLAGTCFAEEAEAWHEGKCVGRSREEIVQFLSVPLGDLSQYGSSTHALSNYHVVPRDGAVEISSMVEVEVIDTPAKSGNVVRRGLLYHDCLHQLNKQWVIFHREVALRYQYNLVCSRINITSSGD